LQAKRGGLKLYAISGFSIVQVLSLFSCHGGMNNLVYIKTPEQIRKSDIYIPGQKHRTAMEKFYQVLKL